MKRRREASVSPSKTLPAAFLTTYDSKKGIEKAKRAHAQGGQKFLQVILGSSPRSSLNRWRSWVHAGLHSKVYAVDEVIESLAEAALSASDHRNSQRTINDPISLCCKRGHLIMKGKRSCIENFSRHSPSWHL